MKTTIMSNPLNPNKAGLFEGCFFGGIKLAPPPPPHISRRTNFKQLLNNLGKVG